MTTSPKPLRVAIVANTLASYRLLVFARLAQLPNLELDFFLPDFPAAIKLWQSNPATANMHAKFLPKFYFVLPNERNLRALLHFLPGLWKELTQGDYDAIVTVGWTMPNSLVALLNGKRHRRPVVLWEESIPHAPSTLKRLLLPLLRMYFGAFDGGLAASNACIEYLVSMGAHRERVFLMPQVADNDFFGAQAKRYAPTREILKRALGIKTSHVILFVGRLFRGKQVTTLLDAFRQVAAARSDVSLLYVGSGPLQAELIAQREAYGLQDRVFVQSYTPQAELPKYYALSDIFVLPSSYDTFGVVVCEAMASGLPIIATRTVGATSNIVQDGVNGLVIEPGAVQPLAEALLRILGDDALRAKMGKESLRIIADWNVELDARNFTACLNLCLNHHSLPMIQTSGAS